MSDLQEHKPAQDLEFEHILTMFREFSHEFREFSREAARRSAEADRRSAEADRRSAEMDRQFKETGRQFKETDRQFKETDRQFKEIKRLFAETDRQMKETDRKISKLGSRIGELIENLVASNLLRKFKDRGLVFSELNVNTTIENPDGTFLTEIDIFLESISTALAVEVKSKLTIADVKEHLKRLEKLRRYADERGDARRFLGAVAAGIVPSHAAAFVIEKGLFLIKQSGETAVIAVPEGFVPRTW
ncbi:MAG: hypothetical protein LBU28_02940 [Spirochaetaceae bacterium]|jgi:hypothetical protein|nr:hypothetical protein [Spirochaetaceae bacterium]